MEINIPQVMLREAPLYLCSFTYTLSGEGYFSSIYSHKVTFHLDLLQLNKNGNLNTLICLKLCHGKLQLDRFFIRKLQQSNHVNLCVGMHLYSSVALQLLLCGEIKTTIVFSADGNFNSTKCHNLR